MDTRTVHNGCLSVTIGWAGGITATATRVSDFAVSVGMVCAAGIGNIGIIWASDSKLLTLEHGYLIGA